MWRGLGCGVMLVAVGCAGGVNAEPGAVTRTTRGDTVVVRTNEIGVWGPLRDAVEVIRVAEDSPETTIGSVFLPVGTPDGGVVFLDSQGPNGMIVRRFDSAGRFMHNLGRQGSGPGEYSSRGQVALAVDSAGTVIIRDAQRSVSRYAPDGTLLNSFLLNETGGSTLDVRAGNDGSVYVRGSFPRGGAMVAPPYIRFSPEGERLDTVSSPRTWLASTPVTQYDPVEGYFPMPDGRVVHIRTDVFGLLMLDPLGGAPPLIAEVAAPPVAYLGEEREELQAIADRQAASPSAAPRATVPRHKPPIRAPFVDPQGRIWLQRSGTAVKGTPRVGFRTGPDALMVTYTEPSVYAAFEPDGTFLGEVRLPMGVYPGFTGDFAWVVIEDADGLPRLVKFRVAPDA